MSLNVWLTCNVQFKLEFAAGKMKVIDSVTCRLTEECQNVLCCGSFMSDVVSFLHSFEGKDEE